MKQILLLFTILLFFSNCNQISKRNEYHSIDDEQLQAFSNPNLSFYYQLGNVSDFGDGYILTDLTCTLKNNTNIDINYLCQSCNELKHYLQFKPNLYLSFPAVNCNATFPEIKILKANDLIIFNTKVLQLKKTPIPENVGLDFRVVKKYIPFDELKDNNSLVQDIYNTETRETDVIWAK
jgi:hypothetical protein